MKNLKNLVWGSAAVVALLCACGQQPAAVPELTKSGINPADYDTLIGVAYDYEYQKFVPDTVNAKPVKKPEEYVKLKRCAKDRKPKNLPARCASLSIMQQKHDSSEKSAASKKNKLCSKEQQRHEDSERHKDSSLITRKK